MYIRLFIKLLRESFRDLIPIIAVIVFFQLVVIRSLPENWINATFGMLIVGIGLAIFLLGLEIGIFPVGEDLAHNFAKSKHIVWLLLFGFLIGFGTTIAEPALIIIAEKAASISLGRIDATILRLVVAVSVGFAILLGIWRIIKGHPIHYYIIAGYVAVVSITFFAPPEIIGLAYDLGGVTTSTVTVPLVAALGIGLASSIQGRNPLIDGFGLIALASLTPMVFVQVYGIAVYHFVEAQASTLPIAIDAVATEAITISASYLLNGLLKTIFDVTPIICIILFFQFIVLKKPLKQWKSVLAGFILVILGLQAFVLGLEMGLFNLGETIAFELTHLNSTSTIYGFAMLIGISTTFAEPALIAIGKKSVEISDGRINNLWLRIFVALGVGIGVTLGAYRIVSGEQIHYYIIAGYTVVIILTSFAPRYIIPIAYDSGGVTTSTITVPLVTALGIGLANNIDGRDALIDGFGLIAFASLFPMITVMVYGIIIDRTGVESDTAKRIATSPQDISNPFTRNYEHSIKVDGVSEPGLAQKLQLSFSALVLIIPKDKKEIAVETAKSAGASGVTMIDAEGMGLSKFDNLFRVNHEVSDALLIFILPDTMINDVLQAVLQRIHINDDDDGIAFTVPINKLNGISLRQADLFKNGESGIITT